MNNTSTTPINRRSFISKMGMATASLMATHPIFAKAAKSLDDRSVLVETAHFKDTGGWVLDTQFQNILGFSYLLAHGLGKPVENAKTEINFPKAGKYHIWVLTKDWCPGSWDAPGQFQLKLGNKTLKPTFGTEAGWAWQSGGSVDVSTEQSKTSLELQDLTGFEGRCSAVYFSLDSKDTPPADLETLPQWRRQKMGLSLQPSQTYEFDLVVVGGGLSGCGAALAADTQGLKVALIHNRPVLGGNASKEIRVHTLGIVGNAGNIIDQIKTPKWPNGSAEAIDSDEHRMTNMNASGVDIFLNHTLISTKTKGNTILSVDALEEHTGKLVRYIAPVFVDASGDGWLGQMAGAEFTYGRESKDEYGEAWDKHGELWSPEKADNRVMGSSVLWNAAPTEKRVRFPKVPWANPVAKNYSASAGEWQWEYTANELNQVDDAEKIRDHMFRAIYGSYANEIKKPQSANYELEWIAFNAGKRESRRLIGDHVFTGVDARDSVKFPDTVVIEKRSIDVHYQEALLGSPYDFKSEALFQKPKDGFYYIPFRSLYSKNVNNLMMAGRCFSCSHIGLGGPRVMNTCAQMGVATGYAAALCKEFTLTPREIGKQKLPELQSLCGFTEETA